MENRQVMPIMFEQALPDPIIRLAPAAQWRQFSKRNARQM